MDHLSVARMRWAVIPLAVGAMVLAGSPAQAQSWSTQPSPNEIPGNNYLYGADSSGPGNVWAVGAFYQPRGAVVHGIALQYDGTAWRSVARTGLPGNEALNGVEVVSPTDVWAVGDQRAAGYDTMVAHWNGTSWTRESTPNGNPGGFNHLYGVTAAAGTVWAVGNYVDPNSSANRRKMILQRTSGGWGVSAAPTVASFETLAAVDATGPADVWAVGSAADSPSAPWRPLALHWNGSGWAASTLPAPANTSLAGVDSRTAGDAWAVGSFQGTSGRQPYAARYDGTSWRQVATPTLSDGGELTDVVALSASAAVAVGRSNGSPLILRWDGTSWTRETTPATTGPVLTGAAPSGSTSVWATGYRFELNAYSDRTLTMLGM